MMKRIAILGSTGSIGTSALKVVDHLKDEMEVTAIAAHSSVDRLEQQVKDYRPKLVGVYDAAAAKELASRCPDVEVIAGIDGLNAVATHSDADVVLSAVTGTIGLVPTVAALRAGKNVALANKEALVSGGALVMGLAAETGSKVIPVDSEHSAIFQCLQGEQPSEVARIILTASGGPFRSYTAEQLAAVTLEQALNHPTWTMGPKVTVDSSTLMNKGLELIEAHWLFDLPTEQIDVVVHPQSIIHSMVEFCDRSIIAQMGETDMVTPIQYALTYPNRRPGMLDPFDFTAHSKLEFYAPDTDRFRCLKLAYDAIEAGGSVPCYMNAANEVLVGRFLERKLDWIDIPRRLETLLDKHHQHAVTALDDVLAVDQQARQEAALI